MASPATTEASEIRRRGRRRLIGAVVLVVLLVVFIPMVLDSEPPPARSGPTAAIPSKENAPPLPAPKAVEAPAPEKIAEAPRVEAPKAAEPSKVPEPVKGNEPAAKPDPAGKPASAPPPEARLTTPAPPPPSIPAPTAEKAPALQGFAVQVGAFRDEAKLRQSREKLVGAGVVHYTERLDASAGPLTRLRAGPFPTREEAEAALAKLKRSSIDGKVVSLP